MLFIKAGVCVSESEVEKCNNRLLIDKLKSENVTQYLLNTQLYDELADYVYPSFGRKIELLLFFD